MAQADIRAFQAYSNAIVLCPVSSGTVTRARPAACSNGMTAHEAQLLADDPMHAFENQIERCFNRLECARRLATRHNKAAASPCARLLRAHHPKRTVFDTRIAPDHGLEASTEQAKSEDDAQPLHPNVREQTIHSLDTCGIDCVLDMAGP